MTASSSASRNSDGYEATRLRFLETQVSALPADPAVLLDLLEQSYLLELLAWDNCPEFIALKRALAAPVSEQQRWIPVKEKRPESGNYPIWVSGTSSLEPSGVWSVEAVSFWEHDYVDWEWINRYKITHWMPLSKPLSAERKEP